jgi:hypothetical protein
VTSITTSAPPQPYLTVRPNLHLTLSSLFLAGKLEHPPIAMWLRGEATIHHCATRSHSPPPSSPNRPLSPKPLIGHALALLCPRSAMPGDTETGVHIPACTHDRSPCSTHARARHRAPDATHPTPCTLADPTHRAAHRFTCTRTKSDHVAAKPVRPRPSHP